MRARKRFGQHFLREPGVVARIVAAIDPRPDDALVEIGPGRGVLTYPLLERTKRLRAIEIDRDLAAELDADPSTQGRLEILPVDVLSVDFRALRGSGPKLRLVGNLPYNISTPLIFHLLTQHDAIADAHFMLQKEVVARMAAAPGNKTYGRLTVMLAPYCRVEPLFDVAPGAFRPAPQVTSTVARILPHATPPFVIDDPSVFARVVAAAFSQRRKKLSNALGAVASVELMTAAGIDPNDRAERIAPAQFAALANRLT
ncbi:MAG TPA: 16S rRNA (adenine(1518)-N(6)/adenine(1519)-N(6))-dimethyltransferase RsmA [Steroidobacteraceae bacterium]|nr:16S rRNA (adenine(1518)-N(6)/adenine(1519)-N(6))-dimethyltransferase RsmA [Steroidobacteraceae bacterium]